MKRNHLYAAFLLLMGAPAMALVPRNLKTYSVASPGEEKQSIEIQRTADQPASFKAEQLSYSPIMHRGHLFTNVRMRDFFTAASDKIREQKVEAVRAVTPSDEELQIYTAAIKMYIENIYNKAGYAEYLSQDATHVTEAISLANEFGLSTETKYSILRLFFNKYKEAGLIDEVVTLHILEGFTRLNVPFQSPNPLRSSRQLQTKLVENTVLDTLTDHFQKRALNPEELSTDLTKNISTLLTNNATEAEEAAIQQRLAGLVTEFTELLFSKTIWYTKEYPMIWDSVLAMSQYLNVFVAQNIITHLDTLDNLNWSLTLRFRWFLELSCSQSVIPPVEFYTMIEEDITSGIVFMFETKELDPVKSKKEMILETLTLAKARAIAYHNHGILPDAE